MYREGLFGVLPAALPVIFEHDRDGLLVVRPGGRLVHCNPRARELLAPAPLGVDARIPQDLAGLFPAAVGASQRRQRQRSRRPLVVRGTGLGRTGATATGRTRRASSTSRATPCEAGAIAWWRWFSGFGMSRPKRRRTLRSSVREGSRASRSWPGAWPTTSTTCSGSCAATPSS